jgi:hypothetical protein
MLRVLGSFDGVEVLILARATELRNSLANHSPLGQQAEEPHRTIERPLTSASWSASAMPTNCEKLIERGVPASMLPSPPESALTIDADAVRAEVERDNEDIRRQRTSGRT